MVLYSIYFVITLLYNIFGFLGFYGYNKLYTNRLEETKMETIEETKIFGFRFCLFVGKPNFFWFPFFVVWFPLWFPFF